jgi:hypothetical protein
MQDNIASGRVAASMRAIRGDIQAGYLNDPDPAGFGIGDMSHVTGGNIIQNTRVVVSCQQASYENFPLIKFQVTWQW